MKVSSVLIAPWIGSHSRSPTLDPPLSHTQHEAQIHSTVTNSQIRKYYLSLTQIHTKTKHKTQSTRHSNRNANTDIYITKCLNTWIHI